MKITAIVNGISKEIDRCLAALNSLDASIEVRVTQAQGDAEMLATDACDAGTELLIACGGDGTLNECLNGMFSSSNTQCMLAPFAIGSANDFARITGKPSLRQIIDCATTRTIEPVTPVQMNWDSNDRYFMNISAAGIGAEIAAQFNRRRFSMHHSLNYYSAIMQWLVKYNAPNLKIKTDAFEYTTRSYLAAVGRGVYAGNGLALLPQNKLEDTELGLTIVGNINVFDFIRFQGKLKQGKFLMDPRIQYQKVGSVEIEVLDGSMAIDGDGEFIRRFEKGEVVTYTSAANPINFIRPNTAHSIANWQAQ